MSERTFPVHRDQRGELVAVEGADLDFAIQRVFTVTGVDGGAPRGGHLAGCTELLVLVTGSARLRVQRPGAPPIHHVFEEPGQSVTIRAEDRVDYELGGTGSVLLVLCDAPYRSDR